MARPENLGNSYFRVLSWRATTYALAMPGIVYRSIDGESSFEEGPSLFNEQMRHAAIKLDGNRLTVFYSKGEDTPERILRSSIHLTEDWRTWQASKPVVVLEPERPWEGSDMPLEPSRWGWAPKRVRQLRDPCLYREGSHVYLLYSVAGESGIGLARIEAENEDGPTA